MKGTTMKRMSSLVVATALLATTALFSAATVQAVV